MNEFWAPESDQKQNNKTSFHLQSGEVKINIFIKKNDEDNHQLIFTIFNYENIDDMEYLFKGLCESYSKTQQVPINYAKFKFASKEPMAKGFTCGITNNITVGKSAKNAGFYVCFTDTEENLKLFLSDFLTNSVETSDSFLSYASVAESKKASVIARNAPADNGSTCCCHIL